jgi:hypothetical protein
VALTINSGARLFFGVYDLDRVAIDGDVLNVTGPEPEDSGLLQAQANRWRSPALRTVRRPTARTEHGYQRFTRLAAHRPFGLDGPDVRGRSVALVAFSAFLTRGSLRSLRSLGPRLSLHARDTLYALRTLRTCGSLWPWVTFGTGVSPASCERKRKAEE